MVMIQKKGFVHRIDIFLSDKSLKYGRASDSQIPPAKQVA
jgi:hypothetical protein